MSLIRSKHRNWTAKFQVRGRMYRLSTRTEDKVLAREIHDQMRKEIQDANDGPESPKPSHGMGCDRFFEWLMEIKDLRPNSIKSYRLEYQKHIAPVLGNVAISLVTSGLLESVLITAKASGLKATSVNHLRSILQMMFSHAEEWSYIKVSPARKLKKLKETKYKARILNEREKMQLQHACEDRLFRYMIQLINHTGMRRSELAALRIEDLDLDHEQIYISRGKSKERIMPMNSTVRAIVKEILAIPNTHWARKVFWWSAGTITQKFQKVRARAGIECRLHDLRHTFATQVLRKGVDPVTVMRLLGHASLTTTLAYMASNDLREAVEKLVERPIEASGSGVKPGSIL